MKISAVGRPGVVPGGAPGAETAWCKLRAECGADRDEGARGGCAHAGGARMSSQERCVGTGGCAGCVAGGLGDALV